MSDETKTQGSLLGTDECRRVLFVCSAGGHLSQLLQLRPWWLNHERKWVTFDLSDAHSKLEGEDIVAAHYPTTRSIPNTIRNFLLAQSVIKEWAPDIVISNGAGVAVPFFLVAKKAGIPTVYLEVYDRVDSRTMTGKLVQPLATRFCVQWPEQQKLYPGSDLTGLVY